MTPGPIHGSPGRCVSTTALQLRTGHRACCWLPAKSRASLPTSRCILPVWGKATGRPLHDAEELTSLSAAKIASAEAYAMAGIGPENVGVAEVHDCFTIAEIVASEDLGFFAPGEGPHAVDEGRTARTGDRPINTTRRPEGQGLIR